MTSLEGIGYVPHLIVPCHSMSTLRRIATSMGVHGCTVEGAYVQGVCVGGICVCGLETRVKESV